MPKNVQTTAQQCLFHMLAGLSSKSFKLSFNSIRTENSDVQTGFREVRGTRDQIANICWIMEKAREFQKKSISALLTMAKPLTVWITINCGKF